MTDRLIRIPAAFAVVVVVGGVAAIIRLLTVQ